MSCMIIPGNAVINAPDINIDHAYCLPERLSKTTLAIPNTTLPQIIDTIKETITFAFLETRPITVPYAASSKAIAKATG